MPALQKNVLSWKEAEELFEAKVGYASTDFYQLQEWARKQGFTVSKIASYQAMMRVKRKLEQIIVEGGTLSEFRRWAQAEALGWNRAYTELVFRQNVFSSYAEARFKQINDPDVASQFDILIYDAVMDARTRPEHARMGGTQWKRSEFPPSWWPPNGYNCRCEVRAVTQQAATTGGWKTWNRNNAVPKPDKGFQRNYSDPESMRLISNSILRNLRKELGR